MVRTGLEEGFTNFPDLWPYLQAMGRPLVGYTLGYSAIVGWFAFVYAALYRWVGHAALGGLSTPHFGDFFFFAITVFPPIGAYSDLKPLAFWAHTFVASELIVGVGYTTVVFADIVTYLDDEFAKVRQRQHTSKHQ